jgi:serine protease Do
MKRNVVGTVVLLAVASLLLQGCISAMQTAKGNSTTPFKNYGSQLYLIGPANDPRNLVPVVVREFEAMGYKVNVVAPDKPVAGSQGTGFVVSSAGHVLTCAHVLNDEEGAIVRVDGGRYEADVLHKDKERDLALLKIRDGKAGAFTPVSFRTEKRYFIGEDVYTIGFPLSNLLGSGMRYTKGSISSSTGLKDDPKQIQISAQIHPGNSGGPLFDKDGVLVGVVSHTLNPWAAVQQTGGALPQNVNFAIKAEVALEYLAAADAEVYKGLVYNRGYKIEDAQKSVAKIRSGLISEEMEKTPRLVARLDYVSFWDVWYRFRLFAIRLYDLDTQEFLFAAGQTRDNLISNQDVVMRDTFEELRKVLRPQTM